MINQSETQATIIQKKENSLPEPDYEIIQKEENSLSEQNDDIIQQEEIIAAQTSRKNDLKIIPYATKQQNLTNSKPLVIACSGGGGHIEAAKAVISKSYHPECLTYYTPVPYASKKPSIASLSIFAASHANTSPYIQTATKYANLPVIPPYTELSTAIAQLHSTTPRPFIDMLLDVYQSGYESASIWNIFQQKDKKHELTQLVHLQAQNDALHYQEVYDYFLRLLSDAHAQGTPYTEVLSTQAIGLPALCDAVKEYNRRHHATVMIHQYITDLPTTGACHYFGALSKLSADQQEQMALYAVNISPLVIDDFFKEGTFFNTIYNIDPKDNPMVRQSFSNPDIDNSNKFDSQVTLQLDDMPEIIIPPNEPIASIMLGSQARTDSVSYILDLIDNGMEKVFVFGGKNALIKEKIDDLINDYPDLRDKIILLGNQQEQAMASLMTRSDLVIISGGGLTIMEQLAMNHNKKQAILIHHANPNKTDMTSEPVDESKACAPKPACDTHSDRIISKDHHPNEASVKMTSGISWEDGNTDSLIEALTHDGIQVEKTCPAIVSGQIQRLMNKSGRCYTPQNDRSWLKL